MSTGHPSSARHLLPGRHLPSSEAEAGTRQSRSEWRVWTLGCCWRQATCQYPPIPPPRHCPANPPDINTAATLLSPMGARHRVPSGRCPHSRRDNVLTCGGGAVGGAAGGSRGAGQFPNIGRTCGDTDQGHGAVTPSRHTGCLVADYHRLSSLLILLQLARFISL